MSATAMSAMFAWGVYDPSAAWLLLLVPLLILLYFLRLRRPRRVLSSLALWQKVLQDQRVNSPFQRFRRNILLLLQLLALLLLILAALQPFLRDDDRVVGRTLVLVDTSASMGALRVDAPGTRMDLARKRLGELVDGLGRERELGVIAFADGAVQVVPPTSNARLLRDGIASLRARHAGADVGAAVRLARAVATTVRIDRVVLLTDGNIAPAIDEALPFELVYERLDAGGSNAGIVRVGAARNPNGTWGVFAEVAGTEASSPGSLVWVVDGEIEASEPVTPTVDGQRLALEIDGSARRRVEVRFEPSGFDALEADNRAFVLLERVRPMRIHLAGDGLDAFERAFGAMEPGEVVMVGEDEGPDIAIASGQVELPAAPVRFFSGGVPDLATGFVEILAGEPAAVVDWARGDALLLHVELSDLALLDRPVWRDGAGIADLEQQGVEVLVHCRGGPMLLRRRLSEEAVDLHMLVRPERTTLPYRVGFPILVYNLLTMGRRAAGLHQVEGQRTGSLAAVVLGEEVAADSVTLVTPAGEESLPVRDRVVAAASAPEIGWYEWRGAGLERAVGVSLLDRRETLLVAVPSLRTREVEVATSELERATEWSIWPWLVAIALGVLLVEWWVYLRR